MTVSSATSKSGPYTGNGVTTVFPYGFRILDATHIQVVRTEAGIDTVLTTGFSVSGVGVSGGGNVPFVAAPTAEQKITLIRNVPFTQTTDLENQGAYYAQTVEDALDLAAMRDQQMNEEIDRSLRLPVSAPSGVDITLPLPQANSLIGWNSDATALQNMDSGTLATVVAFGTMNADTFTGDSVTTVFTLSANPGAQANLDVSLNGSTLVPGVDYTWAAGQNVTLTVAPANGDELLMRYSRALPQGAADAAAVTTGYGVSLAKLMEFRDGTVAQFLADATLNYLGVGAGDVIEAGGFRYEVAASGASDQHVTTAGGVKLYVLADTGGYNVKAFGAVGDGVADDTAEIQGAMDAVGATGGGDLYIPEGTWICSAGLTLTQGVQLRGAGTAHHAFYANPSYDKTGTVLLVTGSVGGDCINFEPNVRGHFGIKSMSIYDNGGAAIRSICRIAGILHPYLEDVEFACLNTARGIGLLIENEAAVAPFSGQAITLYGSFRNVMTGNVQDGLEIRNDCNANSFIGGSFGATRYSLRMTGTYALPVGTFFGGCAFESSYNAAAQVIEYIAGASKIYGWVAQTNAYAIKFVRIEKARGVEFSGCYFENGSSPATYNDGVNGSWPAASVVALDAVLQSDVQNVHFTGCSWNNFLLDRGANNSATGLPFWSAGYNSAAAVALVRRNMVAQVIPPYVYTTIDFSGNNLIYDETSIAYDPATDTLTFKVAGVFLVSATAQFDGYSVATDYAHLRISSGGVEYYGPNVTKGAGVQDLGMSVTAIVSAFVGHTLQVAVFHTGTGINQTISGTASRTYLSVGQL